VEISTLITSDVCVAPENGHRKRPCYFDSRHPAGTNQPGQQGGVAGESDVPRIQMYFEFGGKDRLSLGLFGNQR
jgi:hypothetical protein